MRILLLQCSAKAANTRHWKFGFRQYTRKNGFFLAVQQKIRKDFVRLALLIS
ncbi:hypothetical protein ALO95_05255 [Pseudomonas syringae pv. antirrhini]|uniref:Uncharacterized protein n=1 Tax=Pseudomonas syringae pv. antirrhini TaxID=251702 RepID=A0A0P9JUJ9_9PSED|nr:Uncharacterized protein AC506_4701 [Pseudomonas syringae pv. maculicola str. M6]KPW51525.1 hypothetical protein ALO88_101716 [Pseudomonas syringae pv. antirrhini]KPX73429.1 hypothetical protein ALO84_101389 [Pseudomonas syringae pv. maculicola]RMP32566.1 hypothetical protein ALQ24_101783 [Pseudomonas syringae pv. antirrhini]RMP39971.1 hypothetical protein ALQ23_04540 [Pseudomonas syringae pv. antirrhini]